MKCIRERNSFFLSATMKNGSTSDNSVMASSSRTTAFGYVNSSLNYHGACGLTSSRSCDQVEI